jgi:hypothetical protein
VTLARWFFDEWCRIHDLLNEPPQQRSDRQLVGFITHKHGGRITPHKLASYKRSIANAAEAEAILRRLATAGWGSIEITSDGQKPSTEFVVFRDL